MPLRVCPNVNKCSVAWFVARCHTSTTSSERHAKHFTYVADGGFEPNFVTGKPKSVKLSILFFRQFWEEGKRIGKTG
ncbi:Exc2 family lipoprotein [Serratia nevei]|uniref:Exc2 family lipoprotein n=1 Tax=Serratia nevei TaxID=2703794 RepID=UPI003FA6C0DD